MTGLLQLDDLRLRLRRGEARAVDVVRDSLDRAEALQHRLGAFVALLHETAVEEARRADDELVAGIDRGPWHGLPVAVKDVIDIAGVPTRNGAPGAGHRRPQHDAPVVARLRELGAVVLGKTTTHELAYGIVTSGTRHSLDSERIVGGSSGGSAVAVAAGLVAAALGTDTNGSVRCPAALCGVAGIRPTYGALSVSGTTSLAWSQDTIGVLAPSVEECASLYTLLACSPTRAQESVLRIGTDRGSWFTRSQPEVAAACAEAVEGLAATPGIEVIDLEVPWLREAGAAAFVTMAAEATAAWADELQRAPLGFGSAVRGSLRAGTEISAVAYLQSRRVRAHVHIEMRRLFKRHDLAALALPTVPVTAPRATASTVQIGDRLVPVDTALAQFVSLAPATGQPALSVPCGVDRVGLPVALQLVGRPWREDLLFRLGRDVEALEGAQDVARDRRRAAGVLAKLRPLPQDGPSLLR